MIQVLVVKIVNRVCFQKILGNHLVIVSVWVEVLGQEVDFNTTDNFFEIGGHSLKAATLIGLLTAKFGLNLTVVDLYSCPTVQSLADLLREKLGTNNGTKRISTRSISTHHNVHEDKGTTATPQIQKRVDIAVIGMAGKFPGANNINEFWNNLTKGVDSLRKKENQDDSDATKDTITGAAPSPVIVSFLYVPSPSSYPSLPSTPSSSSAAVQTTSIPTSFPSPNVSRRVPLVHITMCMKTKVLLRHHKYKNE